MLESSLDILAGVISGIIIGIVVSAPMGPVGVLIIQRTLNKGRWFGFITGVGAAISDMIYAMICCLCMSLVLPFLEDHKVALQAIGSLLLFIFGIYTYRSRPNTKLPHKQNNKNQKGTLVQNGVTGFLLTFSNPVIVFLFVMLYAHFGFVTNNTLKLGFEFLGVMIGALGWWLGLTYLISKVRKKFDEARIWRLNRTIGIIVMVVSLMSLFFTITGKTLY
ncbi:MAG: LysE family transporter [Bacteroidaceae bacterium]|nr:LysE family transporter [Bacteroidaceae bacterium]